MNPQEFTKKFNIFPIVGNDLEFDHYLNARVQAVTPKKVSLGLTAKSDKPINLFHGKISIIESDRDIVMQLSPIKGANFSLNGRTGKMVDEAEDSIIVDFNHSMSGVDLVFDVTIRSLIKSNELEEIDITWIDSHDESILLAEKVEKPVVMVLYASWCGWSKKLMEQTLKDPRIKDLRNQFVWAKVDSHQYQDYKNLYGQNGFPMVVVLSSDREVIKKISGYKKPIAFSKELLDALDKNGG
jgi:hypothetical protein